MALGDGTSWDETLPTNDTLAVLIDDHIRDLRVGARSRLALEHEWPSSQSATNQAGVHKFVTLQNQSTKPTLSGTQVGAVYSKTVGSGLQELFWENEAGTEVQFTRRGRSGSLVQIVATQITTSLACAGTIPFDDSIPQITEGTEVFAKEITPIDATNNIVITAIINAGASAGSLNFFSMALFKGSTANAIAAVSRPLGAGINEDSKPSAIPIMYVGTPGTTGAVSYSLRAGLDNTTAFINSYTGSRVFGGVMMSIMKLEEIVP